MKYLEYQSPSSLRKIVKNYWRFEVPGDSNLTFPLQHETLPHSEVSIVFIQQPYFEGIRILGPQVNKFEKTIYPDSTYFGIRFMPWLSFKPDILEKEKILNSTTDCPEVIKKYLGSIAFSKSAEPQEMIVQIEKCLSNLFTVEVEVTQNDLIKFICLELSAGQSVGSTISDLPLSTRVVQKKFKEVVCMSMRKYHSISRQRRLWTEFVKQKKSKTDLLYECGFFDQAHFINDFKKHMNRSHADFEKRLQQIDYSLA